MPTTIQQPLTAALHDWANMQAIINTTVILVRDLSFHGDPLSIIVKINGEEPEGFHNAYESASEIEHDFVNVGPGYVKGVLIWQLRDCSYHFVLCRLVSQGDNLPSCGL